jgi:hypothetical protein
MIWKGWHNTLFIVVHAKVITEICLFFFDDPLSGRLSTLVIGLRIIKFAVLAHLSIPVAMGAAISPSDILFKARFFLTLKA